MRSRLYGSVSPGEVAECRALDSFGLDPCLTATTTPTQAPYRYNILFGYTSRCDEDVYCCGVTASGEMR